MYPPFQQAIIDIDYASGINKYAGIADLAVEAGIIEKNGSWYTYGKDKIQGENAVKEWLPKIPELIDAIDKWLENTGYSTVSEEVKEAEELLKGEEEDVILDTSTGNGKRDKEWLFLSF